MKPLLLLLLAPLAACSTPAAETTTPTQAAVTAYVKANAHDPASYAPVRWGKEWAYTRRDSVKRVVSPLIKDIASFNRNRSRVDSLQHLPAYQDSTRIGTRIPHAYRSNNQSGALTLDSAQFVVYKSGQVTKL
jgi:hypothetical protein